MMEESLIKVVQKKTEDVEEGNSAGKKCKRREDKEVAEAEFSLMVEELWKRVERKWEESENRWAVMTEVVERIAEDMRELLDGLVPEENKKEKEMEEIGAEM